jgi:hypothetical protein
VNVLVGIDMRQLKAARLQGPDLGGGFGFDFFSTELAPEEPAEKWGKGREEMAGRPGNERSNLLGRQSGFSVDKDDMATDAECRYGTGDLCCLIRRAGAGNQSGAGNKAGLMEFEDASIDTGGQAEIVSIDDKSGHEGSLAVALALIE